MAEARFLRMMFTVVTLMNEVEIEKNQLAEPIVMKFTNPRPTPVEE